MQNKERWKSVMKYLFGMIGLALSIDLALLLPEWYGRWRDSQITGQVHLSGRENIEFLDTDRLDIEGRMRFLEEADALEYQDYWDVAANIDSYVSEQDEEAVVQAMLARCRGEIRSWCDNGLMPEKCMELIQEDHMLYMGSPYLYTDQNAYQVDMFHFADGKSCVTLVIDAEKDMMYYASWAGEDIVDDFAQILGFASMDDLTEQGGIQEEEDVFDYGLLDWAEDYSKYHFAAVCEAESAVVNRHHTPFEIDVRLDYDGFEGYAGRRVINNDYGSGLAVMFGSEKWVRIVEMKSAEYGFTEYETDSRIFFGILPDGAESGTAYAFENEMDDAAEEKEKEMADKLQKSAP